MILLIAAVFDIKIKTRWIPSEENVIADAASWHDFKKLTDLGFKGQVQQLRYKPTAAIKISSFRRQLNDYFNSHLALRQEKTTNQLGGLMNHSAQAVTKSHIWQPSSQSPIGLSRISQNPLK